MAAETTGPRTRIGRRAGKALALGIGLGGAVLLAPLPYASKAAAQSQQSAPSAPAAAAAATPQPAQKAADLGPSPTAPAAPAASTAAAAGSGNQNTAAVHIFEWINHSYAADQAMSVLAAPSDTADTLGRLRPGVDVLVVGLVSGGQWLQVRLPDGATVGYVRAADFPTALGKTPPPQTASVASARPAAPEPSPAPAPAAPPVVVAAAPAFAPPPSAGSAAAAIAGPGPASPASSEPADSGPGNAGPGDSGPAASEGPDSAGPSGPPDAVVSGQPRVLDTATLVIDDRLVPLAGVAGLDGDSAAGLQQYIAASGDTVNCHPQDERRYVCLLPNGTDLAMAALVNGAALLGPGAPESYMDERNDAVRNHRGIWASTAIPAFAPPTDLRPDLYQIYLAWAFASPLWGVEVLGDGGYLVDGVPYGYIDGVPRAIGFDAGLGRWGWHERDGRWHDAPDRLRGRLDLRHPRGEGLRMEAGRREGGMRADRGREVGNRGHEGGLSGAGRMEGFRGAGGIHPEMSQAAARGFMQPHGGSSPFRAAMGGGRAGGGMMRGPAMHLGGGGRGCRGSHC